jgi:hypothetical protein
MMKILHKYLKDNECNYKCSLSLSKSCTYLYSSNKYNFFKQKFTEI